MANRETSIAYENLNRRIFPGVGEYGIPQIEPESFESNCEFVGFNYARGKCTNPEEKAVHFFELALSLDPGIDFARENLIKLKHRV